MCLKCLTAIPRCDRDATLPYLGAPGNTIEVRSWFVYSHDDPSHKLIHDIKYNNRIRLARALGRELAMQKLLDDIEIDIILPIPLHWTKHLVRGYNQSSRIARGIRDVTGINIGRNLYARRPHDSQTHRSRAQRATNVAGIFGLRDSEALNGKRIAILDDVITTGATMFSALDTILAKTSPQSVIFLSLSRTGNL